MHLYIFRCLQAAYTIGCSTKGIECHRDRNSVAQNLAYRMADAAYLHRNRDGMVRLEEFSSSSFFICPPSITASFAEIQRTLTHTHTKTHTYNQTFRPGSVIFRQGSLDDAQHQEFLTKDVTHIFFDNWNGVFSGERADAPKLERYVAALFAVCRPGTILCTVSPLRSTLGCLPLSETNRIRKQKGLAVSDDASYYELQESDLGTISNVYSFSEGNNNQEMIRLYRYERTPQSSSTKVAVYMCNNPLCKHAQRGDVIPAVDEHVFRQTEGSAVVIQGCSCGVSERVLRNRKRKTL